MIRDRNNRTIKLTQRTAVEKLLARAGMADSAPVDTPMVAGLSVTVQDCPDDVNKLSLAEEQKWYRSILASIIYFVSWTRPDVALAVSKLCRFMHNPGKAHMIALKRLLRYLLATKDFGLAYDFSSPQKQGFLG